MAFAIPIPDWNSLDSVRHAHSEIEGAALLFFALLVIFDVLAHLSEDKNRARVLERLALWFFAIAVLAEIIAYPYGQRNDTLSERIIGSLDVKAQRAADNASKAATDSSTALSHAEDALIKAGKAVDSLGKVEDEANKAQTTASDASDLAKDARGEAGSAHQEIGKATNQLTQLEAEAQKTESDLINLALCNAPRIITNWFVGGPGVKSYVDPLLPMAGQMVFIEVVPDAEAKRAALNIARTLADAQWNVPRPLRVVDGLKDGVSVQPSQPSFAGSAMGRIPNMAPYWHANDVSDKLLEFLHSYNWTAERGWPLDPQGNMIRDEKVLPVGAIRIQVGLYPPAEYVSPPGQSELTSRLEEMKRLREKGRAEAKRKEEDRLATLPPEQRKRLQQIRDEWEAKTKSATSNGPCQVLNPSF